MASLNSKKEYVHRRARDISLKDAKLFLLNISPMNAVIRFRNKGKIILWYIGPFKVLNDVGLVAYLLALPKRSSGVHLIYHVSMLKISYRDRDYIIK